MNKDLIKETTPAVKEVVKDITVNQKLINGSQLLIIFYAIIFLFFIIDIIIQYQLHKRHNSFNSKDFGPFLKAIYTINLAYHRYGFITVNVIIYIVIIAIIVYSIGFKWTLILQVTGSIIVFTIVAKVLTRVFINKDDYEDDATIRSMNLILYTLLGNFFCFEMSFITFPNLTISLAGLTFSLLLCFYIMLHAIFNPEILKKSSNQYLIYSQSFGIIKGMSAVLICMLTTLYLMVYCCYKTHPGFYGLEYLHSLDSWDILYYVITSFTTVGYGDIVPVRYDGMFYSEYVAILIGISSMFTSTCFVAAVISTANSIAQNTRSKLKHMDAMSSLSEERLKRIINAAVDAYDAKKSGNKEEVKKTDSILTSIISDKTNTDPPNSKVVETENSKNENDPIEEIEANIANDLDIVKK